MPMLPHTALLSLVCVLRETRLGHDGSEAVKQHAFFRTDKWDWHNIRRCHAPFIPEVSSDEDTEYFDEIDPDKGQTESFPPATVGTTHLTLHPSPLPSPLTSSLPSLLPLPSLLFCRPSLGTSCRSLASHTQRDISSYDLRGRDSTTGWVVTGDCGCCDW